MRNREREREERKRIIFDTMKRAVTTFLVIDFILSIVTSCNLLLPSVFLFNISYIISFRYPLFSIILKMFQLSRKESCADKCEGRMKQDEKGKEEGKKKNNIGKNFSGSNSLTRKLENLTRTECVLNVHCHEARRRRKET